MPADEEKSKQWHCLVEDEDVEEDEEEKVQETKLKVAGDSTGKLPVAVHFASSSSGAGRGRGSGGGGGQNKEAAEKKTKEEEEKRKSDPTVKKDNQNVFLSMHEKELNIIARYNEKHNK